MKRDLVTRILAILEAKGVRWFHYDNATGAQSQHVTPPSGIELRRIHAGVNQRCAGAASWFLYCPATALRGTTTTGVRESNLFRRMGPNATFDAVIGYWPASELVRLGVDRLDLSIESGSLVLNAADKTGDDEISARIRAKRARS